LIQQDHLPSPPSNLLLVHTTLLPLVFEKVLYYKMLKGLSGDKKLAARTRFMIRDLLDLREDKYVRIAKRLLIYA
jgi:hypothetical protein